MRTIKRRPEADSRREAIAARVIVGVLLATIVVGSAYAAESNAAYRVLYINSYNRGYAWSDAVERGLSEALNASGRRIELSVEYLDSRRLPDHGQIALLADALASKYRDYRHDLVVVSDNDAFAFAMKYRAQLFPGLPIVFCGYNAFRPEVLKGVSGVTGVNEEVDFAGTVELALSMHPATTSLVFVVSTATASGARNLAAAQKIVTAAFSQRYRIVLLKDLSMQAIKQGLAGLGGGHLVFLVGEATDFRGDSYASRQEYAGEIAAASPVPVYSFWDFFLGSGVLGGQVITGLDQGRAAAALSLKILSGTPADSVPVLMQTPTTAMFDFAAMKRFGIREDALPRGSTVINRSDSFYEKYRRYVWTTAAAFLFLCFVVLVLASLLRRAKRLETELRTSENRFRVLVEQAPEAIVVFDADAGRMVDANANALRLTGYGREALFALKLEQLYSPDQPDGYPWLAGVRANIERVLAGEQIVFERNFRSAKGEDVSCEVRAVRLPSEKGRLIRLSFIDISQRKRAEEALHKRQAQMESLFRGAPVGIGEIHDRTYTAVNDRMCAMFGYAHEELVGQKTGILCLSEAHWEKLRADEMVQVRKKGYAIFETTLKRKDGSTLDALVGMSPIDPSDFNAFTLTVVDISERNAATQALAEAFRTLKLLSARLLNAQEVERRSIANELHDEIGQALTAVNLKLHVLGKRLANGTATAEDVAACMAIGDHALAQVRNLSLNLRPPQLDLMGLEAALRWLLTTRTEASALNTHLVARLEPEGRSAQIDITCFRLVQEALNNAIKHAHARQLWVNIAQDRDAIELRIEDDGTGFNYGEARARAAQGTSVGLLSMEERVVLMGGNFKLDSRLGGGTTICASIPLAGTDAVEAAPRERLA